MPFLDPIGMIRHSIFGTGNIQFVGSKKGLPFVDHAFDSLTYQKSLKYEIDNFIGRFSER